MTKITKISAAPSSPIIHHTLESFVASRKHVQGTDGGHYEYAKDSTQNSPVQSVREMRLIITQHSGMAGGHYLQLPNDDYIQGTVGDEYQGGREELEEILFYDWYVGECTMINDWNQETLTARFEAYCEFSKLPQGVSARELMADPATPDQCLDWLQIFVFTQESLGLD